MPESAEEFYSRYPERMERKCSRDQMPEEFVKFRELFCEKVGNGRILDAGCGPGLDTDHFSRKGFEALGIDISSDMVDYARKNKKGEFYRMDLRNLEFEDEFDAIWCSAAIYFLDRNNKEKALEEFKKVLKEDGILYINFKEGEGKVVKEKWGGEVKEYRMEREEAEELLEEKGFRILKSEVNESLGDNIFINFLCERDKNA